MISIPSFETVAIVSDSPTLTAEISSLFIRPKRYLPVVDGPRMSRSDWDNEVIRRNNALAKAHCRRIILAGLNADSGEHLSRGSREGTFIAVNSISEAAAALKGWTKGPSEKMSWGSDNLGVGLLLARRSKRLLQLNLGNSPTTTFVSSGTHLLIVCEAGNEIAQITASNLAFATDASFLIIPELPKHERDELLEEIYSLGTGGDVSGQFSAICGRVRGRLLELEFGKYTQVLLSQMAFLGELQCRNVRRHICSVIPILADASSKGYGHHMMHHMVQEMRFLFTQAKLRALKLKSSGGRYIKTRPLFGSTQEHKPQ